MRARSDTAKDKRRQALLDAALTEFAAKGFVAARMEDIARHAGLSKGALYLYFSSKEDLFKALLESKATPILEQLEAKLAQSSGVEEAIKAFAAFAPTLIRSTPMPSLIKILIGEGNQFPDITDFYRHIVIERALSSLARLFAEASDVDTGGTDEPELAARLLVAPLMLGAVWEILYGDRQEARIDLDKLFELHAQVLTRGLIRAKAQNI